MAPFSRRGNGYAPLQRHRSAAREAERSDKPCATGAKKNATSRGRRAGSPRAGWMEEEARHRHDDHIVVGESKKKRTRSLTEQVKKVVGVK